MTNLGLRIYVEVERDGDEFIVRVREPHEDGSGYDLVEVERTDRLQTAVFLVETLLREGGV
jgi:hypothetical protein